MIGDQYNDTNSSVGIQKRLRRANNYNRWIYETVRPYVGSSILDVGCSIGNITRFFLDRGKIFGIDVDQEAIGSINEEFGARPNFKAFVLDIADEAALALEDQGFDTVVSFNVLEHVEDDAKALNHVMRILRPGGRLVLLVPAHQALFGSMDRADHHFRRYSRAALTAKLEAAGFVIEKQFWFNLPGILPWWLNGRVLKKSSASENEYSWFDRFVPLIQFVEGKLRPPLGLSIVTVCSKGGDPTPV